MSSKSLEDSWIYPAEVTKDTQRFGKSTITLEVDATQNQSFPEHTLRIELDGKLKAQYRNVGYKILFASKDNRYFVGLSNHGIPGTAFIIFDADGNLIREEKHRFRDYRIYTSQSVTIIRTWYNEESPEVEFKIADDNRLIAVHVRGSNGRMFDLMKPDLGFQAGDQ